MSEIPELLDLPDALPILPIRDLVVFPHMLAPLAIARPPSMRALGFALAHDRLVLLLAQRDPDAEPDPEALYDLGTVGMVMRARPCKDGSKRALVQGLMRARVERVETRDGLLIASVARVREAARGPLSLEAASLVRTTRELVDQLVRTGRSVGGDVLPIAAGVSDPARLANLLAANLPLEVREAQAVLELGDPVARLRLVSDLLRREVGRVGTRAKLQSRALERMARSEREYHLREQLRLVLEELGEVGAEVGSDPWRNRLREIDAPPEVRTAAASLLESSGRADPAAADWVELVAALPWRRSSRDERSLDEVEAILDRTHLGLREAKERLLELIGVERLRGRPAGPILCLVGPEGVGRRSLVCSLARALDRPFARVELAGVRDAAGLVGRRRNESGAMPGRILQALRAAGARDPVMLLDGIDLLCDEPAAALQELLDPHARRAFRDAFLGLPFDLSSVLFVATANLADAIAPALRERLEVIEIAGYFAKEKVEIARAHLLPAQLEEAGVPPTQLVLELDALDRLARQYSREPGVRGLERQLGRLARRAARRMASGDDAPLRVNTGELESLLGPPPMVWPPRPERPGRGLGLVWTEAGGDLLPIEAEGIRGAPGWRITGPVDTVTRDAAEAALTVVRVRSERLGIAAEFFVTHALHLHVPTAGVDGGSAGLAIAAAIVSLAVGIPLREDVALIGGLTPGGRILPVRGARERVLAAALHGIAAVVLPEENQAELPRGARDSVRIVPVVSVEDALAAALGGTTDARPPTDRPMDASGRKC